MCADESSKKKPTMWCKQCRLPLCDAHVGPHCISNASSQGHHVVQLSVAAHAHSDEDNRVEAAKTATPVCAHHSEALKYHCGTCDVAICGTCAIIGDHKKHDNIRLIKDILREKKRQVKEKVDTLEKNVVHKLERSLQAVDDVSTDLARRASEVRSDVRQAGKRAVEMVEAHVEQLVQDVDDLELNRLKILDRQRDELKSHLDGAKNAVCFFDGIMRLGETDEENLFSLLHALDARTTALLSTHFRERPEHHSGLLFDSASDTDLACKTKEAIGKVVPCQASARHSEIEGGTEQGAVAGKTAGITIRAKDSNGEYRTTGGDIILTRWSTTHSAESVPSTTIADNGDGSYAISCVSQAAGTLQLEVYINGEKMVTDVTVKWADFTSTFDPTESHPSIEISEDRREAFLSEEPTSYVSLLGSSPMHHGRYMWKVKIKGRSTTYCCLGVSPKPLSAQRWNDHKKTAFCWKTDGGSFYLRGGVQISAKLSTKARKEDVFQLDLDCERHTLQITHLRSGESSTFSDLPDKQYFQFASLGYTGQALEFID